MVLIKIADRSHIFAGNATGDCRDEHWSGTAQFSSLHPICIRGDHEQLHLISTELNAQPNSAHLDRDRVHVHSNQFMSTVAV